MKIKVKQNRKAKVAEWLARRIAEGFAYGGNVFQIDDRSLVLISGRSAKILAKQGTAGVPPIVWRDMDNKLVEFTPESFLAFASAVDEYIESLYRQAWVMKDRAQS